jgi:hypothetical protein
MSASIDKLHDKARVAIASGVSKYREAAELLAGARKLGATQRQNAKAIGRSLSWINGLLQWRASGFKGDPFSRAIKRSRVRPREQKSISRPPTTAVQVAKAEFQKARAEAVARMFGPQSKQIPERARHELLKALHMLDADHAVERARGRLGLTWDELIVPAEAQSELSEAA